MIQPNEIRLNNWFIGYDSKPFKWEIGHFKCLWDGTSGLELDEIIRDSIPLTEDVLLKCGFEKYIEDGYAYFKKSDFFHLKVFNESGDISYECGDNLKGNYIHFRVDYLHILQNLYFALTNQELEIEL